MSISNSKTTTIPLPTGYRGLCDFGDGKGLEYCDALFAIIITTFDALGNPSIEIGVSYRNETGWPLDYVVTPTGRVTDGDSTWTMSKRILERKPYVIFA